MRKNAAIVMLFTLVMLLIPAVPPVDAAAPVLTMTGGTVTTAKDKPGVIIDSNVKITDSDNATQSSAIIYFGSGYQSGDILTFSNTDSTVFGNIVGSYNVATGVLTLTSSGATASNEQWSHALSAVKFSSSSTVVGPRSLLFSVYDGSNGSAEAAVTVIVGTLPGAPTDVTAVAGDGEATVSFTPPASDGGSAITGYTVTSSPGGFTASGTSSPIKVTGLTNGTSYTFAVTATNGIGTGAASAPSNSVTPKAPATVPGAPTDVMAVAGDGEAMISFTPPASDGGSAITGYTVTSSPDGLTATGTSTSIKVTGLTNGTPYTFTVTATNGVGTGAASAPSNSVTPMAPATVPGAPTDVTAAAGDGEATISFTPPASDGGRTITGYTVTSSPGGFTGTGTSSPIKVTGLTNGTSYTFTVTATNGVGTGAASAPSNSVTPKAPATVPGAPTGVRAAAGNGKATISFTPPASDGGSEITGYTVTSSPGGITAVGTTSPITVTGLKNGTTYTFTVAATNGVGTGPASAASNGVRPTAPHDPDRTPPKPMIDLGGVPFDPDSIDTTKPSVTLEVTPSNGTANVSIPATVLSGLAGENASFFLEIKAPYGSYRVPVQLASLIPGLTELLKTNGLSAEDISFKITLADKSGDESIQAALASGLPNGRVLGAPVDFDIRIVRLQNGQALANANTFAESIERLIPMPSGVTAMPEHWGAFRYNDKTGEFEFVPARSVRIDGGWYAAIRSRTNSVYVAADNAIRFADVPAGHWARTAVELAAARGLVEGAGNGKFAPSRMVSRAEFAAMLVRALGRSAPSGSADPEAPFADVQPGSWYSSAVARAKSLGLLEFAGEGAFYPDRPLTRGEMARMLAAAVALEKPLTATAASGAYKDLGGVDSDTFADIGLMTRLGIMTGTGPDVFAPQGQTTRAQAAVAVVRLLQAIDLID
ncbi:hypothetical protein J19TS2_43780 [Cohnella xylanilytica]|nr:hypothetical protein J19TS2_43780 [Cohnella xylanilytica]